MAWPLASPGHQLLWYWPSFSWNIPFSVPKELIKIGQVMIQRCIHYVSNRYKTGLCVLSPAYTATDLNGDHAHLPLILMKHGRRHSCMTKHPDENNNMAQWQSTGHCWFPCVSHGRQWPITGNILPKWTQNMKQFYLRQFVANVKSRLVVAALGKTFRLQLLHNYVPIHESTLWRPPHKLTAA